MTPRTQWVVVGGFGVSLAALFAYGISQPATDSSLGKPAPAFTAYHTATGDTVDLAKYRGQVILLNIWATWCTPCEAEMPAIQRLYDELKPEGLRVLAVSVDDAISSADVAQWAAARHLTFDILHDEPRRIERTYRTLGVPESFVIDREGRVVKRVTGYILEWDARAQIALFRRLLEDEGRGTRDEDRTAPDSSPVSRPSSLR